MRDLSATQLTATQQKMSVEPVVSFVFTGASVYTYDTDRFLRVLHSEEPSSHKAEIVLQNADGVLTTKTLKGYRVAPKWGLKTSAGNETSETAPLWVGDQRLDSLRGRMICTLSCIGIPDRLAEDKANDNYSHHWSSVKTVKSLITEILSGQPVSEELTEELTEVDGYINLDDTVVEWQERNEIYTAAIKTVASAGATSLILKSISITGTIKKNTKLQITGTDDSIYYVQADATITASEATVTIDPKLALAASVDAVVTLTQPSYAKSSVLHGVGQRLNIPNRTITKLAFRLKKTGSPTGDNVTFKIVDVATYSVLASKTFPISSITTSPTWCEATLASPLLVNEDVWIYCEHTDGTATNYVSVRYYSKDWKLNQNIVRIHATGTVSPSWETTDEECAFRYKYTYAGISVWNHPVNPCVVWPVVYDNDTTGSLLSTYIPADAFYIREGESRLDVLDRLLAYTDCERMFKAATIAQPIGSIHILVPTISGATWLANTAYLLNSYVQPTTPNNNFTYRCTTAGTSHATTEPIWPTTAGGTVTDGGTLVWTAVAHDYKYALTTGHTFFSKANREALVIPNRIVIKSLEDDETQYTGEATSAASYALLPITGSPIRTRLSGNPQGISIAKAYISRLEVASQRGSASVPMNVGAEQWDYVKVTDERQSDFRIGNIGYLSRLYQPGIYQMAFGFGGVAKRGVPGTQLSSLKSEISEYDALYAPDIPAKWGILLPHLRKYAESIDKLQQAISDILIGIDFYDNQLSTDTKIDNALIGLATIEYVNSLAGGTQFSIQSDVTASRVIGTPYQNTTGKPMMVVVTLTIEPAAISCLARGYSGPTSPGDLVTGLGQGASAEGFQASMTFIVPNLYYYKVHDAGATPPTLVYWFEWT